MYILNKKVHYAALTWLLTKAVLQRNVPLSQLCWTVLLLSVRERQLLVSHLEAFWVSFLTYTHIKTHFWIKYSYMHTGRAGEYRLSTFIANHIVMILWFRASWNSNLTKMDWGVLSHLKHIRLTLFIVHQFDYFVCDFCKHLLYCMMMHSILFNIVIILSTESHNPHRDHTGLNVKLNQTSLCTCK